MTRPPPLKPVPAFDPPNVRLAMSDVDGLTPRTPHSNRGPKTNNYNVRVARQPDNAELDEIDLLHSPERQGLLEVPGSSSSTSRHTYSRSGPVRAPGGPGQHPIGSTWKDKRGSRMPVIFGTTFALVILGLTGISIFAPGILETSRASLGNNGTSQPTARPPLDPVEPPAIPDYPVPPPTRPHHPHPHEPPARIIDYSKYKTFPLTPHQYAEECWVQFKHHGHGAFWDVPHDGIADVAKHVSDTNPKYCSTSVTYLLDGSSSGLVAELAVIAQVAQLAIDRNRPFFILDKSWNRGAWSDYFENVPSHRTDRGEPGCLPPPPEELVACPRLARHWVVSFRTAKFHLLHDFSEEFEDAHAMSIQRQRPIYERAVESFASVIKPNARVRAFIDAVRTELLSPQEPTEPPSGYTNLDVTTPAPASYVAVHMRHGDLKPQALRYGLRPIPTDEYVTGIYNAIDKLALDATRDNKPLIVYAASDSAKAIDELKALKRGGDRNKSPWKVVSLRSSASPEIRELVYPRLDGYEQNDWAGSKAMLWTDEERVRYTTGMIVDLALLSGLWQSASNESKESIAPGAVVCGVKSTICTTMALGLGFDRAFASDRGLRWIDIDGRGDVEPVWQAFRLAF